MDIMQIFGLQFLLSTIGVALIARWYFAPRLAEMPTNRALQLLLLPHMFRHLGLAFVVPGLVGANLDPSFAAGAAYGDLASGLLAIVAAVMLHVRARGVQHVAITLCIHCDFQPAARRLLTVKDLILTWDLPKVAAHAATASLTSLNHRVS